MRDREGRQPPKQQTGKLHLGPRIVSHGVGSEQLETVRVVSASSQPAGTYQAVESAVQP